MWTQERDDEDEPEPGHAPYVDGAWGRTANPNTADGELQNLAAFGNGLGNLSGPRRAAAKVVVWLILLGTVITIVYGVIGVIQSWYDLVSVDPRRRSTVELMRKTEELPPAAVVKTDEQWRAELTPQEYEVLRKAGTERAFTGEYTDNHRVGVYRCRACGTELFRSDTKFDSHCGWPSFFTPLAGNRVIEHTDRSWGMSRTEVLCANCHSHLGHVFAGEGYDTPTDQRYCINSISLTFEEEPA